MKTQKILFAFFLLATVLVSCKRDEYFIGGSLHTAKVNMTTYDYLKSNSSGLFDTLILLIDKAGIKDKINQSNMTFFAPTDYAIGNYLNERAKQEQNIDPFRKWSIDSMILHELPMFADSIDVYLVKGATGYNTLTEKGAIFETAHPGTQAVVSYEETREPALGYNSSVSTIPRIVYYTLLREPLTPPFVAADLTEEQGYRQRVQTSGIETTNGMIQVLVNQHTLFFKDKD